MRYCILTNDPIAGFVKESMDYVGFYQWINVFDGQILDAKEKLPSLKDGEFDIIHIRISENDVPLVNSVRNAIGSNSKTKLAVSLDYAVEDRKSRLSGKTGISEAVRGADFVFAAEYSLCEELERLTGRRVYELPCPADLNMIRACVSNKANNDDGQNITINVLYRQGMSGLSAAGNLSRKFGINVRVIFYKEYDKALADRLAQKHVETVVCNNEADFCRAVSEGNALITPYEHGGYGKWFIYAAALGMLTSGNTYEDAGRRCYPTVFKNTGKIKQQISVLNGLIHYERNGGRGFVNFIRESAFHKVEYYNLNNMRSRFLNLIYKETGDQRFINCDDPAASPDGPDFKRDIKLLYGTEELELKEDELAVVCLLKDGMEHLEAFLEHYKQLGAKHFVFIDNGSTDGTLEYLSGKENVTLYVTGLKHSLYESEIRRSIILKLFNNAWCLCVDIDEFFDYPNSELINLKGFLGYMNKYGYTAVVAYMLDMFSNGAEKSEGKSLVEKYCYYDNTEIVKDGYYNHNPNFCCYNRLSDRSMKYYYGGVRREYFGKDVSKYILIKHPLMFIDHRIEPVTDPHFCNKAFVADLSCLLKHYKFTELFKKDLHRKKNIYGYFGANEHEGYFKALEEKGDIDFYTRSSRKYENINDLVESGFLKVSKKYRTFVNQRKTDSEAANSAFNKVNKNMGDSWNE